MVAAAIVAAVCVIFLATREREAPLVRNIERTHFRFGPLIQQVEQGFVSAGGVIGGIAVNARAQGDSGETNTLRFILARQDHGEALVLREQLVPIRTSDAPHWLKIQFPSLAVESGERLKFSLSALQGRPGVSLGASRFDLYPDGRMLLPDGSAGDDQDLSFQVLYVVRPLGVVRFLLGVSPLTLFSLGAVNVLVWGTLVTLLKRFRALRGFSGTVTAALLGLAGLALLLAWLFGVTDVLVRGSAPLL